jgi:lysophospholipase L1-like esterase
LVAGEAGHVVLLGDSIFDNGAYVHGCPDVVSQVRARLPQGWTASLLAVDGAVTSDVERQLGQLPADATHLIVSVGGNDALGASGVLAERANSVGGAVERLATARDRFAAAYDRMAAALLQCRVPAALCTIYDANYPEPQGKIIRTALTLFNDVITRAAFSRALPLVDLRLICNAPDDYANPIEPSVVGGDKIAAAIVQTISIPQPNAQSLVIASGGEARVQLHQGSAS